MPTIDFNNLDELIAYVDQYIVENHNNEITGEAHNNVENGLAKFIRESPRNFSKATIVPNSGLYTANPSDSILVFLPSIIGSVELVENRWNEWTLINQSSSSKQLTGDIFRYKRLNGIWSNIVPPTSAITLVLGKDNAWYESTNRGGAASSDGYDRLEFTIGDSPILMIEGQTVLELNKLGIKNDSLWIELFGAGELPRTLLYSQTLVYGIDYYISDPEKVIITFNQGVSMGQTYIIHYSYEQ